MADAADAGALSGGGNPIPSLDLLRCIDRVAMAVAQALETSAVVAISVEGAKELVVADRAAMLLLDRTQSRLGFEPTSGASPDPREVSLAEWVVQRGKHLVLDDLEADPRFSVTPDQGSARGRPRAAIAVPIIIADQVAAVLQATRASVPFGTEDLAALLWLAPHIAVALHNSRIARELRKSREDVGRDNATLEQRVAERTQQISKAKQEWERSFDAIRDPLFWVDGYRIRRANVALSEFARVPIRRVIGQTCHELLAGASEPCAGCPCGSNTTTGEVCLHGRALRVCAFPIEAGSTIVHYRDITDERALEEKLVESERMAAVGRLAGGAAHEINSTLGALLSNLTTLQGYLGDLQGAVRRIENVQKMARSGDFREALTMLQREDLVPALASMTLGEVPELLRESQASGKRVQEIVNALKALVHEAPAKWGREDPWNIIDRAVARAHVPPERVSFEGRSIRTEIPAAPQQLENAFAHILRNAIQATPGTLAVTVRLAHEGDMVTIRFIDQGAGMSAEAKRKAFEPFFTTREIGRALGLGLTVAYGVITRHGGSIRLESAPGRGTEVIVRLPTKAT